MDPASGPAPSSHPLFAQLAQRHGFAELAAATCDAWIAAPGCALLVLLEEPARVRESLDLAVIAPQLARAFPAAFRAGVLVAGEARAVAVRWGVRRWPALLLLRNGGYVGAIEGLRDWDAYVNEVARLLAAPVTRPPSIGVAVAGANEAGAACR